MVGQVVYTNPQILFILESIRDGVDQKVIQAKYTEMFGNTPTVNQLRYVKNKYGKDPAFGTMLINNPTAGGKKRKRTNTSDSNGPAKSKVSPADKKTPTSEEEKEDEDMKEEEGIEDMKPTTPSKKLELPSSADPYAVPAPPTADSFDFHLPVLHSNGTALAHAPSFPGYDGQESRTGRHSSPGRSPRQSLRSADRHGYSNPQVPNGWGEYMNEMPHRPATSLYASTGFEGNYTLGSTVQGNYQPAQPRQMPQMPPLHPGQFPGVRYPLPDYGYHGQAYNDPNAMGFMPGLMSGAHAPVFSGHGYGPTDPQLQHGSPETRHVHDAHNVFAQNTHWNGANVPGYYDHMQPNHNQMRSFQGTLHSNSGAITQQAQAPPHQDPSHLIPSTAPPPSQSAPPALPEPLPTSSAPAPTDESLLLTTPSPSVSDKKDENPSTERDPRPEDTRDDAEKNK